MHLLERLSVRLALAILSGLAVMWSGEWWAAGWLSQYALPGALFGAGVLWPQLRPGKLLPVRAVALLAVGGVSFWAAMTTALDVSSELGLYEGYEPNLPAYVLASLVGGAVVVVPARWLVPLPTPAPYWVLATVAALVGGVVMYFGVSGFESDVLGFAAFAIWHALLCVALHFGARAGPR
jgi:hypothetical protein